LVLSGLLISDKEMILEQEALKKITLIQSIRENDWIALQFKTT
jgi:ribosomal protein L11 methylase PrmA